MTNTSGLVSSLSGAKRVAEKAFVNRRLFFEGVGQSLSVVCFVVVNNRKKTGKKMSLFLCSLHLDSRHQCRTIENVRIGRKWTIDFISGSGKTGRK